MYDESQRIQHQHYQRTLAVSLDDNVAIKATDEQKRAIARTIHGLSIPELVGFLDTLFAIRRLKGA